jgi:hypothetical protein
MYTSSVSDPGCLSRIPDPTFFHPRTRIRLFSIPDPGSELSPSRSWIRIKEFKYYSPKKTKKMGQKGTQSRSVADPGCLSRITDPTFFHPGSRIPDPNCLHPGSRILIKEFKFFNPQKSKNMVSKL